MRLDYTQRNVFFFFSQAITLKEFFEIKERFFVIIV